MEKFRIARGPAKTKDSIAQEFEFGLTCISKQVSEDKEGIAGMILRMLLRTSFPSMPVTLLKEMILNTWTSAEQHGNNLAAKMELSLLNRNLSGIFSTCYRD